MGTLIRSSNIPKITILKLSNRWHHSNFWCTVELLYSGDPFIADTLSRNQLSQATVKLLYYKPLYSGHLSRAETFSENQWCPLLRGFTVVPNTRPKTSNFIILVVTIRFFKCQGLPSIKMLILVCYCFW